jgi:ATP-binding cassette subfamily C protein LapB
VFDNGKIVADGPADQILTRLRPQPQAPQAAGRPVNVAV